MDAVHSNPIRRNDFESRRQNMPLGRFTDEHLIPHQYTTTQKMVEAPLVPEFSNRAFFRSFLSAN
jgi:hypothetical protein